MSKKMSNTKKMLIEVARQLFAKNGKKVVTMNDIAEYSKKVEEHYIHISITKKKYIKP